MTYGDIRFRLAQQFPGLTDLLDGWIADRYAAILDRLNWERRRVVGTLQTVAPYETGTVSVQKGGTAITGTGTDWSEDMTGRTIRIANRPEIYTFTAMDEDSGKLDRAYEGDTDAAASYRIFQSVYSLPADCKIVESIRAYQTGLALAMVSASRLDEIDAARVTYGDPQMYTLAMEDSSDPPRMQVELWPAPERALGLPVRYVAEAPSLNGTSVTILPWVRPAALIAGVSADACLHLAKAQPAMLPLADRHERRFESAVADMERTACLGAPAEQVGMASRFTRHRARRWTR